MLQKILRLLISVPIAIALIALAVINRHDATLVLDPFRPESPALSVVLPFYVYLFAALAIGILAGGMAVWFNQGRWRNAARVRTQEARRWQAEADRLSRERDQNVAQGAGIGQKALGSSAAGGAGKSLMLAGR